MDYEIIIARFPEANYVEAFFEQILKKASQQ